MHSLLLQIQFLAQGSPSGQPQGGGSQMMIIMVLMFVMMYFLLIRPQRKQQKEHQERLNSLQIGDEIVTTGGIHGIVSNIKDGIIKLKVADNVKIEMEKSSVASIKKKSDKAAPDSAESAD